MSCKDCAQEWNEVFTSKGAKCKVQILQVPEIGNGIFRVAACDEHFEALKKIVDAGLIAIAEAAKPKPKPKDKGAKNKPKPPQSQAYDDNGE